MIDPPLLNDASDDRPVASHSDAPVAEAAPDWLSSGWSLNPSDDYSQALEFLYARVNYERTTHIPYQSDDFKLDRMRELAALVGDPQLKYPVVHIAGTKGKGSTAAMIAAVLQRSGYRTGLYTSPHLERIEERWAIDGQVCPAGEVVELVRLVAPAVRSLDDAAHAVGQRGPTFFEVTTAMAMLHFARQRVDAAVLEVGLGGRLDSTNICQPRVSVITSISFDHTRQLGNTLAAIAGEKAGIIKSGVPVVSGVVADEPREVIRSLAQQRGAMLIERDRDFRTILRATGSHSVDPLSGPRFDFERFTADGVERIADLGVNLLGDHQAENAATALAALSVLVDQGWKIPESAIRSGLQQVRCPARIEVVQRRPDVILDTAHNVASIDALCRLLERLPHRPKILIFATSRDKDLPGMLQLLLPQCDHIIFTQYLNNPRARESHEAIAVARQLSVASHRASLHEAESPAAAWDGARRLAADDALLCIAGSFFLAAEMRPLLAASHPA
jgi:dihydrofolate synthase / folylpolyglutamate synthase